MSVVAEVESFRVQDDPRVVELMGKLNAARPALSQVSTELASARERLAVAVGEADLAEALAEIGEGPKGVAERARAEAVELERDVALLEAEQSRKSVLQEVLSARLVEAEEAAAVVIRARVRALMVVALKELDVALKAAMRANREVARLELKGRGVLKQRDSTHPFFSWDALRSSDLAYNHSTKHMVPRQFFESSEFGTTTYEEWRRMLKAHGFGLDDE